MKPLPPSLRIFVLYYSDQGRETTFYQLARRTSALDAEHYEPAGFWQMQGGIEVVLGGYNTILHDCHFYVLVKATSFLLHSLYWLKGETNDWFDRDEEYPDDVVYRTTDDHLLRLERKAEGEIALSFLPVTPGQTPDRGDKFFDPIVCRGEDWFSACRQALGEYFQILQDVAREYPNDSRSMLMMEYYDVWRHIESL